MYLQICHDKLVEMNDNDDEDIDVLNSKISEVLRSTAEEVFGRKKACVKRKSVPWWNEECNKAIKERNRTLKKVRKSMRYDDFIVYKKAQAIVRRSIRAAKRKY